MKWAEQQALFKAMVAEEMKLLVTKGSEYASDHDALANFKDQARDVGVSPLVVLSVLMNKHYRSLQSYIRAGGKTKSNEPIEGRIADLRNYLALMAFLIKDLEAEKVEKKDPAE
jgi:hypothetical protein